MKKVLTSLLILVALLGCGTTSLPKLTKFERPPRFPQACDWASGKYLCRLAVIWDHSSSAKSCLSQQEFLVITGHVIKLNHVIDLYETQTDEWNNQ